MQAQATWLRASETPLTDRKSNPGFLEWLHCFFYSGDPQSNALAMLLTLQREEGNLPWSIYLAAALGSALRNNMDAAHLQMKLAIRVLRTNLDGLLLPAQSRYHFDNLLSTEQMAELQPYFANENQ